MPTIKKQATQLDRALPKQPAKSWPNIALAHPVCDGPLTGSADFIAPGTYLYQRPMGAVLEAF